MEISSNLLAAYAEGNISESERKTVRQYLTDHPEHLETVMIMMDKDFDIQMDDDGERVTFRSFDEELDALLDEIDSLEPETVTPPPDIIPLRPNTAKIVIDNLCAVRCQRYVLRTFGEDVSDKELEREAKENGWFTPEGTPLDRIGLLSEKHGVSTTRKYDCSMEELIRAVSGGAIVIATIGSTKLSQSDEEAEKNDLQKGDIPNHVVIVKSVDLKERTITIIDPGVPDQLRTYPMEVFQDAWDDSSNYTVILSNQRSYEPHPLNLDDVSLEPELLELREELSAKRHIPPGINKFLKAQGEAVIKKNRRESQE